jgi:hypothetical protein
MPFRRAVQIEDDLVHSCGHWDVGEAAVSHQGYRLKEILKRRGNAKARGGLGCQGLSESP